RDHSLLVTELVQDRTRFRLLRPIREYLIACAPPEMLAALRSCDERHARHYARLAQQIDAGMRLGAWSDASAEFWREIANIRRAVAHSIENDKLEILLDLAGAVGATY